MKSLKVAIQVVRFTVSRFALFFISMILCIAEDISLIPLKVGHTGNTEKKYLSIS
jgi:hypothetical protein